MHLPPFGLCLPCTLVRVRDGDTVEVRLRRGGLVWAIRLLDCWVTDDRKSPLWQAAKGMAEQVCGEASDAGTLAVFIPFESIPDNPLAGFTFDRVLGKLFLDTDTTLGDLLIRHGLASCHKGGEPTGLPGGSPDAN